ncbi:hypothetical protein U0358_09375 [Idiomarina sp. PL1-037]|uniref:hypothetical protein n=1 Tax=Idiomarina sp. PL1-037 TaxID=3095365 RepID=UPI002ACC3189|nr:hypothetical protein [Idiomarina sp. PL1-037]WQC52252.1 hypothetical protein U0358_09375 [Idiomarina sp. PL1-037]
MRINPQAVQPLNSQQQVPQRPAPDDQQRQEQNPAKVADTRQVVPDARQSQRRAERWESLNTFYDEPPQRSQKALNAYQNIALSEKREQITSMFGVDVYA